VILLHGKSKRCFQQWLGIGPPAELQEQFAEKDPGHHPVGFFGDTDRIVWHGLVGAAIGDECLRQTESKHFVVRLALDERAKLLHARNHGLQRVDEDRHARCIVRTAATHREGDDFRDGRLGIVKLHQQRAEL